MAWWQDATATGYAWQGGKMPLPRVGLAPVATWYLANFPNQIIARVIWPPHGREISRVRGRGSRANTRLAFRRSMILQHD